MDDGATTRALRPSRKTRYQFCLLLPQTTAVVAVRHGRQKKRNSHAALLDREARQAEIQVAVSSARQWIPAFAGMTSVVRAMLNKSPTDVIPAKAEALFNSEAGHSNLLLFQAAKIKVDDRPFGR
ncbi:MAG: hypothetical protein ABI843_00375 [Dokdonella sp.]